MINPNWNSQRNLIKAVQTLLGICTGIIIDKHLNDDEINFLATWLMDNQEVAECFPGNVIHERIQGILSDGIITDEKRTSLLETLEALTGAQFQETGTAEAAPARFPVDDTVKVNVLDHTFCLTGKFITGTRSACERMIVNKGGFIGVNVTQSTDYLVIGTLSSPDWLHANHGLKIQKAVELRDKGHPINIITEQHWANAINEIMG